MKQKHFRKYLQLNVGDKGQIYTKGAGNYISGRGIVSRCSEKVYTIEKLDRDMTFQKMFVRRIEKAEVTT